MPRTLHRVTLHTHSHSHRAVPGKLAGLLRRRSSSRVHVLVEDLAVVEGEGRVSPAWADGWEQDGAGSQQAGTQVTRMSSSSSREGGDLVSPTAATRSSGSYLPALQQRRPSITGASRPPAPLPPTSTRSAAPPPPQPVPLRLPQPPPGPLPLMRTSSSGVWPRGTASADSSQELDLPAAAPSTTTSATQQQQQGGLSRMASTGRCVQSVLYRAVERPGTATNRPWGRTSSSGALATEGAAGGQQVGQASDTTQQQQAQARCPPQLEPQPPACPPPPRALSSSAHTAPGDTRYLRLATATAALGGAGATSAPTAGRLSLPGNSGGGEQGGSSLLRPGLRKSASGAGALPSVAAV
jgi:hypothetical protein